MKTPHKHAEIIKAWADGAEIEYRVNDANLGWSDWKSFKDLGRFLTDAWCDYRIKPEPKPDMVYYGQIDEPARGSFTLGTCFTRELVAHDKVKLTFDGSTGKLKSVEML